MPGACRQLHRCSPGQSLAGSAWLHDDHFETLPRTSALDRPGLLASIADAVTRIFFARPRGSQVDDRLRKPIRVLIGNPQGRVCRAFDLNRRMVPMCIDTLSPRFGRELQTIDGYRELTE